MNNSGPYYIFSEILMLQKMSKPNTVYHAKNILGFYGSPDYVDLPIPLYYLVKIHSLDL